MNGQSPTGPDAPPAHVLVTGAGSGIGRAIALDMLQRGASVSAVDRDTEALRTLVEETNGERRLLTFTCDVSDENGVESILLRAEGVLGPVGGLAHAAGVLIQGLLHEPALTTEQFALGLRVNLLGSWLVGRAVVRRMVPRRAGSLVFVTSNAGTTPRVNLGAYCCSKAGATMLARCFALELAPFGIRSNALSPGSTDTPMLRDLLGDNDTASAVRGDPANYRTGIPLGCVGQPLDVARAAAFLLSDAARHITGTDLRIDGGATWS